MTFSKIQSNRLRGTVAVVLALSALASFSGCGSGTRQALPGGMISGRGEASAAGPAEADRTSDEIVPQGSSPAPAVDGPSHPDQQASDDHQQPDNTPDNPPPPVSPGLNPRLGLGTFAGGGEGGDIHRISVFGVGNGVSLSAPATMTGAIGNTDDANIVQQCNAEGTSDKGARVAAKIKIQRGKYVENVALGCKGVAQLDSVRENAEMLSPLGDNIPEATVPFGFALSGLSVETCRTAGADAIAALVPMAKRVETWGVNDDVEWAGPMIKGWAASGDCQWTELSCPKGSVLSGLRAKTGESMDGEAFLGGLAGICNPVKNDLVSRPVIVSAELQDYERIESEGLKAGEQTCSMTCPDGYFVTGMRYGRSHEYDDGTRGVTGAALLCKSVRHPADSVAVDLYDTQGPCGGDLYDYYDRNGDVDYSRKFSSRTVFFTGFGAHAISMRTGKQAAYDQIRAMVFYQTPVDLTRQAHTVWVGAYWSFFSAAAGNGPGAEQVLSCPSNKILTAVEFRTGETLKLTGIRSYTCAGVKVEIQ